MGNEYDCCHEEENNFDEIYAGIQKVQEEFEDWDAYSRRFLEMEYQIEEENIRMDNCISLWH